MKSNLKPKQQYLCLDSAEIAESIVKSLIASKKLTEPYRHWFLQGVFPLEVANSITELPIKPPMVAETKGRRETNNSTRKFFAGEILKENPVCSAVTEAFQSKPVVKAIAELCSINLNGSLLRIEYCQDAGSFWLEPHRDINVKRYTMQVYFCTGPDAEDFGTTIYNPDFTIHGSAPSGFNKAMIFIPQDESWHGFHKRDISGVRKSLIINYVDDEWQSRHELAYPDTCIDY